MLRSIDRQSRDLLLLISLLYYLNSFARLLLSYCVPSFLNQTLKSDDSICNDNVKVDWFTPTKPGATIIISHGELVY